MTLQVLIVDDEALARTRLRHLLGDCRSPDAIAAAEAATAADAMALLQARTFDLVLLDIQMPGADGMALAAMLQEQSEAPLVVFVTAHAEYAVQAFDVNAVDYLTKPVRLARLQQALQKVAARRQRGGTAASALSPAEAPVFILAATHDGLTRIPVADVLYLKAEDKYVTARTGSAEHLLDDSLVQLERDHGARFIRIHRNALVARNAVRRLARERTSAGSERWVLYLADLDEALPVSRRQLPPLRALLAGTAPAADADAG